MQKFSLMLYISLICILGCSSDQNKKPQMDASVPCILSECTKPFMDCMLDKNCRAKIDCADKCSQIADPEQRQLCLVECTAVHKSQKFMKLSACMAKNGCITPPDYTCALPQNRAQIAPVTLTQMEGAWYVIRGLSKAYDCYSSQKMAFRRISDTVSKYDYTYIPGKGGSMDMVECTITAIPFSPSETAIFPGRFRINYNAYGIEGADDMLVLSNPSPDYMLLYYCGQTPSDKYRGSIVISRSPETRIPADIEKELNKALANAGLPAPLTLNDYCVPDNSAGIEKK